MSGLFGWFGNKKETPKRSETEFFFRADWPHIGRIDLENEGQFFFLNDTLIAGASDKEIIIFSAEYGNLINKSAKGSYIQFADISPNKKFIIVSRGREIELYKLDIKDSSVVCEKIADFKPQSTQTEIVYAKFLTDNLLIWISRRDDKYHVFNIEKWIGGSEPFIYSIQQPAAPLRSLMISPDGNSLAIGEQSTYITPSFRIIDTTNGETLWKFDAKEELPQASVTNFGFSHDSGLLAAGYYSGSIYVFETRTGELTGFMPSPDINPPEELLNKMKTGHRIGYVIGLIFDFKDPDNKSLISASGTEILRFDINSWKFKKLLYPPDILPQARIEGDLVKLKINPAGDTLAAGFTDGNILFFDALYGRQLYFLKSQLKKSVSHMAFSPQGNYLLASYDGTGYFWDDGRAYFGKTAIWNIGKGIT